MTLFSRPVDTIIRDAMTGDDTEKIQVAVAVLKILEQHCIDSEIPF
jgi:hypothetical protein